MQKFIYVTGTSSKGEKIHIALSAITHVILTKSGEHVASVGDPGTPGAPLQVTLDKGEWDKIK